MTFERDAQYEKTLISGIQEGNTAAYEALIEPYRALMYHLARRLLGTENAFSLEELVQAGYIGLMQAAKHFDLNRPVQFITYAVPWAIGEMKAAMRRMLAPEGTSLVSMDAACKESGISLADTLQGTGIDIEAVSLRHALTQLEPDEQHLIILRFFRDMTQKETSALLHKSQTQISRIEQRALDHLRDVLA